MSPGPKKWHTRLNRPRTAGSAETEAAVRAGREIGREAVTAGWTGRLLSALVKDRVRMLQGRAIETGGLPVGRIEQLHGLGRLLPPHLEIEHCRATPLLGAGVLVAGYLEADPPSGKHLLERLDVRQGAAIDDHELFALPDVNRAIFQYGPMLFLLLQALPTTYEGHAADSAMADIGAIFIAALRAVAQLGINHENPPKKSKSHDHRQSRWLD